MAKIRSLADRLRIALDFAVTGDEKDEVYALLNHVARRTLNLTAGEFYNHLKQIDLEVGQYQGLPNQEEIDSGKRLAIELWKIEQPPREEEGKRGYGPKYERSRFKEFEAIRDFYKMQIVGQ